MNNWSNAQYALKSKCVVIELPDLQHHPPHMPHMWHVLCKSAHPTCLCAAQPMHSAQIQPGLILFEVLLVVGRWPQCYYLNFLEKVIVNVLRISDLFLS